MHQLFFNLKKIEFFKKTNPSPGIIFALVASAPFQGARVMVVGCRGAVNINPRHLMLPEASIKGVALGTANADQYNEMGCAIVAGIEAGWIRDSIQYNLESSR